MRSSIQRAPSWLQELVRELIKPPYFMQQHVSLESKPAEVIAPRAVETHRNRAVPPSDLRPSNKRQAANATANKGTANKSQKSARQGGSKEQTARPALDEQTRAWQAVFRQADFPVSLPAQYGWEVVDAKRVAQIIRVHTDNGDYALKRTHIPAERVVFLQNVLKHVEENGFTRFAPFVSTTRDRPYCSVNGEIFYASKWLEGQPTNFSSVAQIGQIAHALAQFYEASKGFSFAGYRPPTEFKLYRMLQERTSDLRELLALAQQTANPDKFDQLLLQLGPALRHDAERALSLIENEPCKQWLSNEEENPGLCHLDVIPANFVYDQNRLVSLLDFDLSTNAPRVLDLAHLLRRSLQRTSWDTEGAYACFLHYNAVSPMAQEEYVLVHGLLTFPYQAWRIAHTRYRIFKDAAQISDLETYAEQETRRQAFLAAFAEQITRLE